MERIVCGDVQKDVKLGENPDNCNVTQKFPTLNVQSENSYVKIGDEFNFSKNVLIVVPDKSDILSRSADNRNDLDTEKRLSPKQGSKTNTKSNNFEVGRLKQWLHRYDLTPAYKVAIALFLLLIFGILVLVLLTTKSEDDRSAIPNFVNRSLWGSQPRKCAYSRLREPVALVIIQQTSGLLCCNFAECQQSVKNSQNYHQSHPYYCDTRFAFLVGGDCRIYEGRSFAERENLKDDPLYDRSVEVAFIGEYSRDQPRDCQLTHLLTFFQDAVTEGFLSKDFKVVAASQVYQHQQNNPGKYLMEKIKEWDEWTNATGRQLLKK